MKHKYVLLTVITLCLLTLFYTLSFTTSGGPAAGKTGAPGDALCTDCHTGTANTGLGTVSLSVTDAGNPITAYTPGTKYTVTATVTESGRSKFGFQMVPFLNSNNTMAGSWTLTELTRTQTKTSGSKVYVEHTATGNVQTSAGTNTWSADWTAPTTGSGTVKFYAAFNATNSNGSPSGDNIYTTSFTLTEEVPLTPPVAGFSVSGTTICLNGSVSFTNLSTDATSYLWDFGDGTNSTAVNPTHTYSTSGTFTVSLAATGDGGTDVETKNNFIVVNPAISADAGIGVSICTGVSASLLASATGGNGGPYSYSWAPSTGLSSATISNPVASPSVTTVYTVFVSDGCSPEVNDNVTITVLPSITVNTGPDVTICTGASTSLSVSTSGGNGGPYSFSWVPSTGLSSATISNPVASPSVTTVYAVFVSDGCSPEVSNNITITVRPPLTATASSDIFICEGNTIPLNVTAFGGTGSYTFSWVPSISLSDVLISNPVASPSATTTYTVYVDDGCSSMASDEVTVSVYPTITAFATANPSTICQGQSVTLSASASGGSGSAFTYSWTAMGTVDNPNMPITSASPSATSNYIVYVGDGGCSQERIANVIVMVMPPITINTIADFSLCIGEIGNLSATATGGDGEPYSYSWTPTTGLSSADIPDPAITISTTTTYTLYVSDGCSPEVSNQLTVTVNPDISLSVMGDKTNLCSGEFTQLSVSANGGNGGPYLYSWSPSLGLSDSTSSTPFVSPGVTSVYTCFVSDECSPVVSGNIQINVSSPLSVTVNTSNSTICIGEITEISAVAAGGSGVYTYSWVPTAGIDSPMNDSVSASPGVTTNYTVFVTDECPSTANASQTITVNDYLPSPVLNCGNTTTSTIEFVWESVTGAISYETSIDSGFTWVDVGNALSTSFSGFVPDDSLQMQIRAINPSLCSPGKISSQTCIARNCNALSASVTNDTTVCFNSPVELSVIGVTGGSGSYFYSWSSGFPDTPGPHSLNIISPVLITVYIGDSLQAGCPLLLKNINVGMYPLLAVNAGSDKSICFGRSVPLNASVTNSSGFPLSYSWVPSAGLDNSAISNPVANPSVSTTYSVYVTDGCSPEISDVVVINVGPSIFVNAGPDVSICEGDATALFAMATGGNGGPYSYSWLPSAGLSSASSENPIASPAVTTDYTLFVSDGCSQEVSDVVRVVVNNYPEAPVVNCGVSTTSSIEFTWNSLPDVFGFEISLDSGFTWMSPSPGPLSHVLVGLSPGINVQLNVRGIGTGMCSQGKVSAKTCSAINCIPLTVAVTSDTLVCKNSETQFGILSVTGGSGNYTYIWSDGLPSTAGLHSVLISESHQFSVTVADTGNPGCAAVEKIISAGVYPNLAGFAFSMAGDTVYFIPDATFGNSFVWNFGDGITDTSSSNIFHSYDTSGVYTVCMKSVTAEECVEEFCDSVEYVKVGIPGYGYSKKFSFSVTPNPGKGEFQLTSSCCRSDRVDEVWILNLQGQVLGKYYPDFNGKFRPENLNKGMYFLKIRHITGDKIFWNLSPVVISE